jgi:hypothetical protein
MATAIFGRFKYAASIQFSGRALPKGLVGQSPLPFHQLLITDYRLLITGHRSPSAHQADLD